MIGSRPNTLDARVIARADDTLIVA